MRVIGPDDQDRRVPVRKVKAVDICGAGDSFSAGAACALAATGDPVEAAWFGNLVASITVQKTGTGTASPEEVMQAARGISMRTLAIDIGGTKFSMACSKASA